MNLRSYLVTAAIAAGPVLAQQPGTPQKTTEQQARSYVASAFITGAAPVIMSEKVMVSPALRQYLSLPPEKMADAPTVVPTAATTGTVVAPVEAPKRAPAAPAPIAEPQQKPQQVVEPTIPRMTKPAAAAAAARPVQPMASVQQPPRPLLKPNGPCAIK